jgi:hypothetical protein
MDIVKFYLGPKVTNFLRTHMSSRSLKICSTNLVYIYVI